MKQRKISAESMIVVEGTLGEPHSDGDVYRAQSEFKPSSFCRATGYVLSIVFILQQQTHILPVHFDDEDNSLSEWIVPCASSTALINLEYAWKS